MKDGAQAHLGYANLREDMIRDQIVARGVRDARVLEAIRAVPREVFAPEEYAASAYEDRALPVGPGQTISQPFMVAYMTAQLQVRRVHRVLEVGTGTGYQAAILGLLAEDVVTVERDARLARRAAARLAALGHHNVDCRIADGGLGWPIKAPYDRIMVTAGSPSVPSTLVDQLVDGGAMVLPVGGETTQTLLRIRREGTKVVETPLMECRFVPLVGVNGWRS